jgi:tetratricopeptide (TPR) repeat protein
VVLEQLLAVAPGNSVAQALLARVQLEQQDIEALEETAARILRTRPEHGLGHYLSGIVLQRQEQWEASLGPLEKARGLSPEAAEPQLALARSLMVLDRLDESEGLLRGLLELQPDNLSAILLGAEVSVRAGRAAAAMRQLREAILLQPRAPSPYQRLASLKARQGDVEAGIDTLSDGLAATERNGFLLFWQGVLLEQLGRHDDAATAYEEVLERYPDADAAANNLAMLNVTFRNTDPQNLSRALAVAERFRTSAEPGFQETLGWVLVQNDRPEEGLARLEPLRERFGDNPEFQYHLGMAYLGVGRTDEAKAQLAAALAAERPFPGDGQARTVLERL